MEAIVRPASGRRILLLTKTDFADPRDGGSLRVAALVRELTDAGFVVDAHVVRARPGSGAGAPGRWSPGSARSLVRVLVSFLRARSVSALTWFSPRVVREVHRDLSQHRYDLTILEFTQLLGYLPVVPRPVLVDMHNVESELMANYARSAASRPKRLAARYEASALRRMEALLPRRVDAVATVSQRDADLLRDLAGGRATGAEVVVASNGVSDEAFDTSGPRTRTVVFVAHLGWRPNVDAAEWLVGEVWPHVQSLDPDLVLQLVGRSPAASVQALRGSTVEVHADVPSVLPYVTAARVATAPLLAAGGTRLKILEALACGTPVAATPLGALGLESLEGPHLRLARSAEAFAHAVVDLARQDPDRDAVRAVVEPYRWRNVLAPLVEHATALSSSGAPERGRPRSAPAAGARP
ncbi:glycosyltransferase involved in cell wall biosynthesis [Geodermatophilus bullaregiensis]|uniref:glycosyltransferase n=1 Tax=Geodermatophilus bullaregiensis TaxID=1564160 RepID=UPI00195752E2|nr:glycosyltransferase [Geodermatophilus bullaregiensis]MBM7807006.1 glycosyltransferase involved in cell wall biosynthesis [Geodermatophilus bullaregiensis]